MSEAIDLKKLENDIKDIKRDLEYIKKHMIDADVVLSDNDREVLEQARDELNEGKTISLDALKDQL